MATEKKVLISKIEKWKKKIVIILLCTATSSHIPMYSWIAVRLGKSDRMGSKVLFTTRTGLV